MSIEYNPEQLDTNLKTNNQGTYLSSLMTTALSLVNCSSIKEVNEWINSVPNLYDVELIDNTDENNKSLEKIKRDLFDKYQDSMVSLETNQRIGSDKLLYALHKKVERLKLPIEEEKNLGNIGLSQGRSALYSEIEKICLKNFGEEKGKEIYTKIVNYSTADYENFNSATYDQIVAFNEQIKSNIESCKSTGGDYQLVISSLSYENTTNKKIDGSYEYNYGISEMGKNLADKLGCSCRIRSMITRQTAEEMKKKNLPKNEVIDVLRDSLRVSLDTLNKSIVEDDKRKRTYELFNELIEIKKQDEIYENVWEKNFGITIDDMLEEVIKPNMDLIMELKTKNVDFMYNETMLQESENKRNKVEKTYDEIETLSKGLIDVFGNQDHTFCGDYKEENIGQLQATAKFMIEMSKKVKIECTEKDLYFSKKDLDMFKKMGLSKDEILVYKQTLLNKNGEINKEVPYQRECEWTTINNISGEFIRDGISPNEESYMGKYTRISSMGRLDNSEKISKEMEEYNSWKNEMFKTKENDELGRMLEIPKEQEEAKVFAKEQSDNNQGTVGIFDLVAVIGIAVVVTLIFIIINMIK